MHRDPATYDEERELTLYVWHNYRHLLTPEELKVWNAVVANEKAAAASPRMAKVTRDRLGAENDPQVAKAMADGFDLFQRKVRDRILAGHPNEVMINRCARCQRIVATPKARQCLWCGHYWHQQRNVVK